MFSIENINAYKGGIFSQIMKKELSSREVKALKRNLLGFFGRSAVKSLEEISLALVKVGIAKSSEDAKIIAPQLISKHFSYGFDACFSIQERGYDYILPPNNSDVAEYVVSTDSLTV